MSVEEDDPVVSEVFSGHVVHSLCSTLQVNVYVSQSLTDHLCVFQVSH